MNADRPAWRRQAEEEYFQCRQRLREKIAAMEQSVVLTESEAVRRVTPQIEHVAALIQSLQQTRFPPARWYYRLFRLPRLRSRMHWLTEEPLRASETIRRSLENERAELWRLERDPKGEIEKRFLARQRTLQQLEAALLQTGGNLSPPDQPSRPHPPAA